jgi:hypothetical protein
MIINDRVKDLQEKEPLNETSNRVVREVEKESCKNENSLVSRVKAYVEHFQGLILALLSAILVSMSTTLNKKAELFTANEQAAGREILKSY